MGFLRRLGAHFGLVSYYNLFIGEYCDQAGQARGELSTSRRVDPRALIEAMRSVYEGSLASHVPKLNSVLYEVLPFLALDEKRAVQGAGAYLEWRQRGEQAGVGNLSGLVCEGIGLTAQETSGLVEETVRDLGRSPMFANSLIALCKWQELVSSSCRVKGAHLTSGPYGDVYFVDGK